MAFDHKVKDKKGKFIGGAAATRKKARRLRIATPVLSPMERVNSASSTNAGDVDETKKYVLPLNMHPMERYFATLLKSDASLFMGSHKQKELRTNAMKRVCGRVRMPLPRNLTKIPGPDTSNYREWLSTHTKRLAALVLEESRFILAEALHKRWGDPDSVPSSLFKLRISSRMSVPGSGSDSQVFFLRRDVPLTPSEASYVRTGCVVELLQAEKDRDIRKVVLGSVVQFKENDNNSNENNDEKSSSRNAKSGCNKSGAMVAIMLYEPIQQKKLSDGDCVFLHPLGTLISQARQFEACTNGQNCWNVGFARALMGGDQPVVPTHTRFRTESLTEGDEESTHDEQVRLKEQAPKEESDHEAGSLFKEEETLGEGEDASHGGEDSAAASDSSEMKTEVKTDVEPEGGEDMKVSAKSESDDFLDEPEFVLPDGREESDSAKDKVNLTPRKVQQDSQLEQARQQFVIPELNGTQKMAQTSFLESPTGSICLVQGPPGTGKTTLLTSTICNYLLQSKSNSMRRRLMVCAPTNKAVTVLASRFLQAAQGNKTFNVVLVGDGDKLLVEDHTGLADIFAYSWVDLIAEKWKRIKQMLRREDPDCLLTMVNDLINRIQLQIPDMSAEHGLIEEMEAVTERLVQLFACCGSSQEKTAPIKDSIIQTIEIILDKLKRINAEHVTQELLHTADVIFCTLTSAGAAMVKKSDPVDDLIVDEAAAATEPELYIPFHLRPRRLMAVGDPKQLPATVTSRFAASFGLNRSLMERLMYNCDRPYVMLDVQYRMKPAISMFPSNSFYDGKITNGPNVISNKYCCPLTLLRGCPFTFLHVPGKESRDVYGSSKNVEEARRIVGLLIDYRSLADQVSVQNWFSLERIRIITFYQAQVNLLRQLLRKAGLRRVMVSTVDSSQGCEADVIIISFVRRGGQGDDPKHTVGFLTDDRRINVALTRAKYQLICVGNADGLARAEGATTIQSFLDHCKATRSVNFNQRQRTQGRHRMQPKQKQTNGGNHKKNTKSKYKKRKRTQADDHNRVGGVNGRSGKKTARTARPSSAVGNAGM